MLETLLLSEMYTTVISLATSPFLPTPDASHKSTIRAFVPLSSRVINAITTLFLFTKSDIKTVLIPVVSHYADAPWCASAENYLLPLDGLCNPFTAQCQT